MEIDDLIDALKDIAAVLPSAGMEESAKICRKAAETIKLLRECVVDADNEKWHRMIDNMGEKGGNGNG